MQSIDIDETDVDNVDRNYCDEFVCTSSPAVEQTVKSLARELQRGRFATQSLFAPKVTYSDGFRSFSGPQGYSRQRWLAENVDGLAVSILKMEMVDKSTAAISWRARGSIGSSPVDMRFTTTVTLNLLTGRIEGHKESWDLSRMPPPTSAKVTANRVAWSLQQRAKDMQEGLGKATESISNSMDGGGDASTGNPNGALDPTRFYQGGGGGGNNDIFSLGLAVAMLYLAFKFFEQMEKFN